MRVFCFFVAALASGCCTIQPTGLAGVATRDKGSQKTIALVEVAGATVLASTTTALLLDIAFVERGRMTEDERTLAYQATAVVGFGLTALLASSAWFDLNLAFAEVMAEPTELDGQGADVRNSTVRTPE